MYSVCARQEKGIISCRSSIFTRCQIQKPNFFSFLEHWVHTFGNHLFFYLVFLYTICLFLLNQVFFRHEHKELSDGLHPLDNRVSFSA